MPTEPSEPLMRAATLAAPHEIRVELAPRPRPAANEVRVRLEGCGVCASNLEPWEGTPWTQYPGEPGGLGHEGWGVVESVGANVTTVRPGQRVATLACRSYAEYDVAPITALAVLPDALGNAPFPGEPLACACNIFRRSDIRPGQTVAIIGIGFLGAALTRLASEAGARVVAISRRASSLELAREFGAAETIPLEDYGAIGEQISRLTRGRMCERVIECVGYQGPLDLAADLVSFGGKLVIAGYHQDGPRQVPMQLWNWKGIDVINAHERDPDVQARGLREAVDAVASGRIDLQRLLTHTYPLEELGEALAATRAKPDGFVKAWVRLA